MANHFFRGQLPFQTFNKTLNNNDGLYLLLNELDRDCIIHNKEELDEIDFYDKVVDPRTQEHVKDELRDATKERTWTCFNSEYGSKLNRYHHAACLRVLHANSKMALDDTDDNSNSYVKNVDKEVFQSTLKIRTEEYSKVQKYAEEQEQLDKEHMYRPMKYLVTVYMNWYAQQTARLLQVVDDMQFVTILGLPQVHLCNTLNNETGTIAQLKIIERKGKVRLLKKYKDKFNYRSLRAQLETCVSLNDTEAALPMKQFNEFHANTFMLPLESLLFLLTAGDYIDLPTEMLLDIQKDEGSDYLSVHFELPLPSRDCGWHTNCQLVERVFAARISMPGQAEWFNITPNGVTPSKDDEAPEIDGKLSATRSYKVQSFDDHLKNMNRNSTMQSRRSDFIKSNQTVMRWQLTTSNPMQPSYVIYNSLSIPAVLDNRGDSLLGSHQIKLENKSEFGCEIMTKYELLKAWLQLSLLEARTGLCTRVDLETFDVCLEQFFTINELEQKLKQHYNICMPKLFGNLYRFFQILLTVKPGKHLLRYNSKHTNQLMLCASTKDDDSRIINLHSILKLKPTDYEFMSQDVYLPIAEYLCSAMHLEHQLMPCAFWPKKERRNQRPTRTELLTKEHDRILKREQNRKKEKNMKFKKKKRARKNKQKNAAKARKNISDNEIDKIFTL